MLSLVLFISACKTDAEFSPPTDISNLYWSLRLNSNAVTMSTASPYNSVQLEAIPYTPDDKKWEWAGVLEDAPNVTTIWVSSDSSKVRVSSDGTLIARATTTGNGVNIIVRKQIGTLTHSDTARVRVTALADPPKIKSLSITPKDSLKRASGFFPFLIPTTVLDSNDAPVTGMIVGYRSSNASLAAFLGNSKWNGSLAFLEQRSGTTSIVASSYIYGTLVKDSFVLEVGYPISMPIGFPSVVQIALPTGGTEYRFNGSRQEIGPGGEIIWENGSGVRPFSYTGLILPSADMSVIFDDPSSALEANSPNTSGSGDIIDIPGDSTLSMIARRRYRRFVHPGEYKYTVQPWGFRGAVIVHER